jgi:hypothetical protein
VLVLGCWMRRNEFVLLAVDPSRAN